VSTLLNLCTVARGGGGGVEGRVYFCLAKPVLSVNNTVYIYAKEMFEAHCSYQGHYRIKPLPAHCTVHSPDVVLLEEAFVNGCVYLLYFCCRILCVEDTLALQYRKDFLFCAFYESERWLRSVHPNFALSTSVLHSSVSKPF
jgi:hypothetical protein